ncbi:F-box-like/WD repeat-containing protein ebi, partial [Pseudolycoriella hygida]
TTQLEAIPESAENMAAAQSFTIPEFKVRKLFLHRKQVFALQYNTFKRLLASGSVDGTVRIWNLDDYSKNKLLCHYEKNATKYQRRYCNVSSSDGSLLATACFDGYVRIWTAEGDNIELLGRYNGAIYALKWNKQEDHIVSSGELGTIVWHLQKGIYQKTYTFQSEAAVDVDWRTHTSFATCTVYGNIYVYHLELNFPIRSFHGHRQIVNAIQWNPQGQLLASCSNDGTIKLWSMAQDTCVRNIEGHWHYIDKIKWSPTGPGTANPNMKSILASASQDHSVRLWDVELGRCILNADHYDNTVYTLEFSPDGKYFASGGFDHFVYIWDVQSGLMICKYKTLGEILNVCWLPCCTRVVAGCSDGKIFLLDLRRE